AQGLRDALLRRLLSGRDRPDAGAAQEAGQPVVAGRNRAIDAVAGWVRRAVLIRRDDPAECTMHDPDPDATPSPESDRRSASTGIETPADSSLSTEPETGAAVGGGSGDRPSTDVDPEEDPLRGPVARWEVLYLQGEDPSPESLGVSDPALRQEL